MALVLVLLALAFGLTVLPGWIVPSSQFGHKTSVEVSARVQRQNEIRTIAVQAIAGIILAFGALYTARTYTLSREGQVTDRLRLAVDQVHAKGVSAVGGILALERLAGDSDRDRRTILELLATYVRMEWPVPDDGAPLPDRSPTIDAALQTALTAIVRHYRGPIRGLVLNLAGSDLHGADLRGSVLTAAYCDRTDLTAARLADTSARKIQLSHANLARVEATRALLRGAILTDAKFPQAMLGEADIRDADMRRAHLQGAFLGNARLSRTNLSFAKGNDKTIFFEAKLNGSRLRHAEFSGALFWGANLRRADFESATLKGAQFSGCDLRKARFVGADLTDADLRDANCRGADFRGAILVGALLDGAQDANFTGATLTEHRAADAL